MTQAEKKAKELVDKFFNVLKFEYEWNDIPENIIDKTLHKTDKIRSKQGALICVDEIQKRLPCINETPPIHRKSEDNYKQFWKYGVKQAINKM